MKALVYEGPGKKSLEERPVPKLGAPTDAIVKVTKTTICGTDLHILKGDVPTCTPGRVLGHEGDLAGRKGIGAEGGDEIGADIFRHQCAQHPQRVERVTGVAQSPAGISRGQLDHAFANARNGFQSRIPYLPPS